MINLKLVRLFQQPLIAAASGLAKSGEKLFLVADDENLLYCFSLDSQEGEWIKVLPGTLPEETKQRKKKKPDFEALIDWVDRDSFLLFPSGSTAQRQRAVRTSRSGDPTEILDLGLFFRALDSQVKEINIEGGVSKGDSLLLLQRGNGPRGENGIIHAQWEDSLKFLQFQAVALPSLQQVPLTFTDACWWGDHILFLAVAEDSPSTYEDGVVLGSALGLMRTDGKLLAWEKLDLKSKPEGICLCGQGEFFIVTDDDDRTQPSKLLIGSIPSAWGTF